MSQEDEGNIQFTTTSAFSKKHNQKQITYLCASGEFLKRMSCLIINLVILIIEKKKLVTCSRCVICASCSVHVISTYYVRKGSWAFFKLNYPQINDVKKFVYKFVCLFVCLFLFFCYMKEKQREPTNKQTRNQPVWFKSFTPPDNTL